MSEINSVEFQRKYRKSKIKLRQWEDNFFTENGRLPTKADIKVSPASVRQYYKVYWYLKTKILEAEILGEETPEDNKCLEKTESENVLKDNSNSKENTKNEADESSIGKGPSKENVCVSQSDVEIWGPHLNKSKTALVNEKEKCGLLSDVVTGRLFKGSSFKKRNPRKALSFSKKKSNKSLQSEDGGKSFDSTDISSIFSPCCDSPNDITQESSFSSDKPLFSVENDCSPNIKALITTSTSLSPLLKKCDQIEVVEEKTQPFAQPVSLIQVVASDPLFVSKPVRSLDAGWVERCNEAQGKEERKSSSDSGFESMEFSIAESDIKDASNICESSDDDLIAGSDNELDEKTKPGYNLLSQKRKSEISPKMSPVVETVNQIGEKVNFNDSEVKHIAKKIKIHACDEKFPKTKEEVKKAILENKMKSGTLNDNYVRINLKKKVFVRGKKHFNMARYKKKEWKNKKKNLDDGRESGGLLQCYKCGETGHFSRYCQKQAEDKLLPVDDEDDGTDQLPTLEEAEKMAIEKAELKQFKKKNVLVTEKSTSESPVLTKVEPFYRLADDISTMEVPMEVYEALEKFGHSQFRPGQKEAILRILLGQSTLLTIATGGGKSLCYQLPAYLYAKRSKCITLVVSPLVSLMEDQVAGSSSFFKVGCLHTSQTQKQRETVVEDAQNGKLYALLVSPEAVVSGDHFTGFGNIFQRLPPIAFACIDEVHCVSQWSHNFRPSYLMISKVLREKLGITTILGLTATATISTIQSITAELGISCESGVIKDIPLPDNLCLSVSRDTNKDEALLHLLNSPRFKDSKSILIYCTRRDECERLAVLIRTVLQSTVKESKKISSRLSWNAESYHAGMAAARRKQVQKAFMCGNLRIVVATVAFGMGINKQDIRGVIHYNMPKDFESYVQEVGRAGRDGMLAHCHLFLDSNGRDLNELRRHVHSNSVDRHVLRKLLQRVFIECDCNKKKEGKTCEGHEIAFDCNDTVQSLDLPEENIYTLLCYLELQPKKFLKVLSPVYINCRIQSYKGMKMIVSAAKKCPPLAYACALNTKWKKEKSNVLEFNVVEVANKLSWDSALVKSQLKSIEWDMTSDSKWKKTGIAVEFSSLGFRVCSRGDLSTDELDEALEYLIKRVNDQENRSSTQLNTTFSTLFYFSTESYDSCFDSFDESKSNGLKKAIRHYFETEEILSEIPLRVLETESFDEEALAADVRVLLSTYRDNTFNGRAVARIFHGIQSPNYPASLWFKCRYWRKHIDKDFKKICRIATREILRMKI